MNLIPSTLIFITAVIFCLAIFKYKKSRPSFTKTVSNTFVLLFLLLPLYQASARVTLEDDKLSVSFQNITLAEALSEIATATGIQIETTVNLDENLNFASDALPPKKLLAQLLNGKSAIYLYEKGTDKLARVRIISYAKSSIVAVDDEKDAPSPTSSQFSNGQHLIEVSINHKKTTMLIDTGASKLSISGDLAREVGLPFGNPTVIKTASGITAAAETTVNTFELAGQVKRNVEAIIIEDLPVDGLIGNNILREYTIITDDQNNMKLLPIVNTAPEIQAEPAAAEAPKDKKAALETKTQ